MVEQLKSASPPEQAICRKKEFFLQKTTESCTPVGERWQESHPILPHIPLRSGEIRFFNDDLIMEVVDYDPQSGLTLLSFRETSISNHHTLTLDGVSIANNVVNICNEGEIACRQINGKVRLVASLSENIRLHGLKPMILPAIPGQI